MQKFLSIFVNILKNSTYYYSSKNYYYQLLSDKHNNGIFYFDIANTLKTKKKIFYSNREITPISNKKLLETEPKDIIRKHKKPLIKNLYKKPIPIQTLFYKEIIGTHKCRIEFIFLNEKLFMYTYTFPYLLEKDVLTIIEIIKEKYLKDNYDIKKITTNDLYSAKIITPNENIIFVENKVNLIIYYLNPQILDSIVTKYKAILQIKMKKKAKKNKKALYKNL